MTRLPISGDYSADWAAVSLQTRDEAGWRCVRCRHAFDSKTGRPLHCDAECDPRRCRAVRIADRGGSHNYGVHHLDGDKSNNRWWNRLALCNSCHLYVQASVIPERLFMFTHSPWFVPYVCGYYAHVAGIVITRDEAIATPEKWLALGQPYLFEAVTP
ncbi:MAG: hypothetical protein JWM41_2860 [Gemmatimonadetes bacterium]|nr:hypothetical protein [Gemmatimonadota bacterium]